MARLSITLLAVLSLLAIFSHVADAACSTPGQWNQGRVRRWRQSQGATVGLAANGGWTFLPDGSAVCGATLKRDFRVNAQGLTLPLYISSDVNPAEVERVVIGTPTKLRDGWAYFAFLTNARNKAFGDNADVDKAKTVVIVPQFLSTADKDNGIAAPTDVIFKGLSWSYGANGYARAANGQNLGGDQLSSFDMMDRLIDWANQQYPKATRNVIAGHSLGAQMVNRYSALRKDQLEVRRIDYVIGNPGSWVWMTGARPRPNAGCAGVDSYKYGLADGVPAYTGTTDRKVLLDRLTSRRVHVLLGSKDFGPGDTSCQAGTQGRHHLERGNYYIKHITKNAAGGVLPSRWTVDYANCSHDPQCMFSSDIGIKRLMLDGLPSRSKAVRRAAAGRQHAEVARSLNDDEE